MKVLETMLPVEQLGFYMYVCMFGRQSVRVRVGV